jgi:hypothetical protein
MEAASPEYERSAAAEAACFALGYELALSFVSSTDYAAEDVVPATGPTYADGLDHAWQATSFAFVAGDAARTDVERSCVELGIALADLDIPRARSVTRSSEYRADGDRLHGVADGLRDVRSTYETRMFQFLDKSAARLSDPRTAKKALSECFTLVSAALVSPTLENLDTAARALPAFDKTAVADLLAKEHLASDDSGRLTVTPKGRARLIRQLPAGNDAVFE